MSNIALCWGDRSDSFNLCPCQHNCNGWFHRPHRPHLASPPSEVFPSTGLTHSLPPIHYCTHCSSPGRLCINSCPRVVPNSRFPNPVPHAQYGVQVETSENSQEAKTVRGLRVRARLAVPNSYPPNPVSDLQEQSASRESRVCGRVRFGR